MPIPLLPDPVALTIQALLAQTSLTALVGTRMYDRIPGNPTWPLLVVSAVSDDEERDPALGAARVQVDCWGAGNSPGDTATAQTIARTVRSTARDLAGTYAAGMLVDCSPALFAPAPDPTTGRARFVADLLLTTHA